MPRNTTRSSQVGYAASSLTRSLTMILLAVVLGDWYHTPHSDLMRHFISRANPGGAEPVPDSALIYFVRGHETTYLAPISGTISGAGNVGFNENATLPFEAGKTYRLRVLNTSAFAMFYFWLDGHDMEIIEVDGVRIFESVRTKLVSQSSSDRHREDAGRHAHACRSPTLLGFGQSA
jgi:iron transport multicopper oxidase